MSETQMEAGASALAPHPFDDFPARFPRALRFPLIDGGIACGDGWRAILEEFFIKLEAIIDLGVRCGFERAPNPIITAEPYDEVGVERETRQWVRDDARGDWVRIPYVDQVKEKLGGLCIYMSGAHGNTAIEKAIDQAAAKALHTCEVCAEPGTIGVVGGYVGVRCHEHKRPSDRRVQPGAHSADSHIHHLDTSKE